MSRSQEPVVILDGTTKTPVNAILHIELGEIDLIDVEIVWAPARLEGLRDLRQRGVTDLPQHVHWNWAMKAMRHSHLLAYRSFGIEAEGKMQGLIMVLLSGKIARLSPDTGKPLVYIDFLETAPWNAKEFTNSPLYKGVGIRLVQAAARLSREEGFGGRIGLHALSQSRPFYTMACQMQSLGPDPYYQNLEYYELGASKVAEFLNK